MHVASAPSEFSEADEDDSKSLPPVANGVLATLPPVSDDGGTRVDVSKSLPPVANGVLVPLPPRVSGDGGTRVEDLMAKLEAREEAKKAQKAKRGIASVTSRAATDSPEEAGLTTPAKKSGKATHESPSLKSAAKGCKVKGKVEPTAKGDKAKAKGTTAKKGKGKLAAEAEPPASDRKRKPKLPEATADEKKAAVRLLEWHVCPCDSRRRISRETLPPQLMPVRVVRFL